MIEPDIIQGYYQQLTDQELIDLATKEGVNFTDEAIEFLFNEFQARELDTSIFPSLEDAKVRNKTTADKDTSNWDHANNARKAGKSDTEILQELTAKGVDEAQAALIINRLPVLNYENEEFYNLIASKCRSTSGRVMFSILVLFGIGGHWVYDGVYDLIRSIGFYHIIFGIIIVMIGFYRLKIYVQNFKNADYWIELLKTHPENIVWLKPFGFKRILGISVSFLRRKGYQFSTKDENILPMILNERERLLFFEGVKCVLPHGQIGFTSEMEAFYFKDPENFINSLQERQLYSPVQTFETHWEMDDASFHSQ